MPHLDTDTDRPHPEICFRHSHNAHYRSKTLASFSRLNVKQSRIGRYAHCGMNAWVVRSDEPDPTYQVQCDRCHDRFCPACARERGSRYADRIAEKLQGKTARMVTLTLRHTDQCLGEQISRLLKAFASLRRTELWRKTQTGGVSMLEVKQAKSCSNWHPHLHIITEGRYLPQKLLSQAWLAVTGDSYIVDVRAIRDAGQAVQYVTKYVTKPIHGAVFRSPGALDQAIQAFQGRRLCTTFGSWRGYALNEAPDAPASWIKIDRLKDLIYRANHGDTDARDLLRKVTNSRFYRDPVPDEDLSFG